MVVARLLRALRYHTLLGWLLHRLLILKVRSLRSKTGTKAMQLFQSAVFSVRCRFPERSVDLLSIRRLVLFACDVSSPPGLPHFARTRTLKSLPIGRAKTSHSSNQAYCDANHPHWRFPDRLGFHLSILAQSAMKSQPHFSIICGISTICVRLCISRAANSLSLGMRSSCL